MQIYVIIVTVVSQMFMLVEVCVNVLSPAAERISIYMLLLFVN